FYCLCLIATSVLRPSPHGGEFRCCNARTGPQVHLVGTQPLRRVTPGRVRPPSIPLKPPTARGISPDCLTVRDSGRFLVSNTTPTIGEMGLAQWLPARTTFQSFHKCSPGRDRLPQKSGLRPDRRRLRGRKKGTTVDEPQWTARGDGVDRSQRGTQLTAKFVTEGAATWSRLPGRVVGAEGLELSDQSTTPSILQAPFHFHYPTVHLSTTAPVVPAAVARHQRRTGVLARILARIPRRS